MMENRILPMGHDFVQQTLRDFRVWEDGEEWVARLKGEGRFRSSVFPESERQVLVELLPRTEWPRPAIAWRWLAALRLPYLLFSLLPLVLVLAVYHQQSRPPVSGLSFLLLASVFLIHASCNLWSDYEDHLRGVDSPGQSGGSGVIQKLWIPAVHIRNAAALLMISGCVLGVVLLAQLPIALVGKHLVWLSLVGALGAASYSGWPFHYKYLGLGEPIVFFLSGPIVTLGASLVLFRDASFFVWFALVSLPLSFLAVLRLHSGNMQRIPFDSMAGVSTIARSYGFRWSKWAYGFLLFAPFLSTGILISAGLVGRSALAAWVTLPLALYALRALRLATGPLDPACRELRLNAARLHFSFGLVYSLSHLYF